MRKYLEIVYYGDFDIIDLKIKLLLKSNKVWNYSTNFDFNIGKNNFS